MEYRWDYGEAVRVIRNIRDDGTYPGKRPGDFLIRRGSTGFVVDVGTFLQDQVIYSVNFFEEGIIVGCREEELIGIDEEWFPSLYEFREKVCITADLAPGGELLLPAGSTGEIMKVLQDESGVSYHVHFDDLRGRVFRIPERLLESLQKPYLQGAA
jgi:nitrogen fixation protein NifZ